LASLLKKRTKSVFWLEMMAVCEIVAMQKLETLLAEAHELSALFTASQRAARANR
jgi:hypothetical protein